MTLPSTFYIAILCILRRMEETAIVGPPTSDQISFSQHQTGQDDEISQEDRTSSSSSADRTQENNVERNNNDAVGDFGPYSDAKGFFDVTSKTTVAYARMPLFPLSRVEADKVSTERSIILADSVVRKIKGKHGLDVKVPLFIKEERSWLMYVLANYKKELSGILYDTTSGEVACSTKSLSTICTSADATVELDSSELDKMDHACLKFFGTMRFQEKEEQLSEGGKKLSCHCVCLMFLIRMFLYYHYRSPRETHRSTTTDRNTTRRSQNIEEK